MKIRGFVRFDEYKRLTECLYIKEHLLKIRPKPLLIQYVRTSQPMLGGKLSLGVF
jgi:hypothetical protein